MTLSKKLTVPLAALALVISAGGGIITAAHADTGTTITPTTQTASQGTRQRPAAVGTVTAVSGDSITLTDKQSNMTYTVDATNATITKHTAPAAGTTPTPGTTPPAPTTITVSQVAVGDTLMVQGTVSGTNITATKIEDGMFGGGMGHGGGGMRGPGGQGVRGTVTAVNGTTLTVTGSNGTTYTVDGAASTASKISTISVADIQVGDSVGIDGSVSGTTVTAKNIMDGVPAGPATSGTSSS